MTAPPSARATETGFVSKAGQSDLLYGTSLTAGKSVPSDGAYDYGPSVNVRTAATLRALLSYVKHDEASVDVIAQVSDDGGTTWFPVSTIEAESSNGMEAKNVPVRLKPTGTNSIGVDTLGSLLYALPADVLFRVGVRQNTPGATAPVVLIRARRGYFI